MLKKLSIRFLLVLSFLIPFVLSFPVWLSQRSFPVVPMFFKAKNFSYGIDVFFITLFWLFALLFLIRPKTRGGLLFFISYVGFCILDQTRIQPFFFEISLLILFYDLFRNRFHDFKIAVLILLAGTYIWSGLHKINPYFHEVWLKGLNNRIPFVPLFIRELMTYAVPFLEMLFGIALLFKQTRKLGIYLLALMHFMVLVTLLLGNGGFTVFPLNVLNVVLLLMICYNLNWNIFRLSTANIKLRIIAVYSILLPALNLVGFYDHLLSFSYFSGKPYYCNIIFNDEFDINKLPPQIQSVVRTYEGGKYINLNEWSVGSVHVSCYPEERVYVYLKEYIEMFVGVHTTQIHYYKY